MTTVQTKVLVMALALGAVVALFGIWYLSTDDNEGGAQAEKGYWVRVARMDAVAAKGIVFEPQQEIYVVHANGKAVALSARVPHERTDYVRFCPSSGLFETHYLLAKFDRLGIYYSGPGKRSLDRLQSKIERGVVFVNPVKIIRGPARGERDPMEPEGPFCEPG